MNSQTFEEIINYSKSIEYQRNLIAIAEDVIHNTRKKAQEICDHSYPEGASGIIRDKNLDAVWCRICQKSF